MSGRSTLTGSVAGRGGRLPPALFRGARSACVSGRLLTSGTSVSPSTAGEKHGWRIKAKDAPRSPDASPCRKLSAPITATSALKLLASDHEMVNRNRDPAVLWDSHGPNRYLAIAITGFFEVKPVIVWSRFTDGAASMVERRIVPLGLAYPQDNDGLTESGIRDTRLARIEKQDQNFPCVNWERPHVLRRFAKAQAKFGPSSRQLGPFDRRAGADTSSPDFKASALSIPPADRVTSAASLLELARRVGSPAAGHISGVA